MKTCHGILCSVSSLLIFGVATLAVDAATPGGVWAWGAGQTSPVPNVDPEYGQAIIPAGLSNATNAIATGVEHTLALKSDGTVVAWGRNLEGQTTTTITATATGTVGTNTITLSAANIMIVPGLAVTGVGIGSGAIIQNKDSAGLILTLSVPNTAAVVNTQTLTFSIVGAQAVAAGGYHSLALKTDGTVLAWGAGTTNTAVVPNFGQSLVPNGLTTFTAVPVTINAPVAGTLNNQVILANVNTSIVPGMMVTGPAGTVGAGAIVIAKGGTTLTLSVLNTNTAAIAPSLTFSTGVVAIAAGAYHSMALRSNGTVVAWGRNDEAQTTVPFGFFPGVACTILAPASPATNITNFQVTLVTANTSIVVGQRVTGPAGTVGTGAIVTAKSGTLLTLSEKNTNTAAIGLPGTLLTFSTVPQVVTAIAAGNAHSVALRDDNTVAAWGRNVEGQTRGLALVTASAGVSASPGTTVTLTAANPDIVPGMLVNGATGTVGVGAKVSGVSGTTVTLDVPNLAAAPVTSTPLIFSSSITAAKIAAGGNFTMFLKSGGVTAQGSNANGQTTIPAGALSDVTAIAAGGDHALALKTNGTVLAWGKIWNGTGFVTESVPACLSGVTAFPAGASVTDVAAGAYHSAVIVVGPPIIVTQPLGVEVPQGGSVTLSVVAMNAQTYQWRKNGVNIAGATGATLALTNVQAPDSYTVVITNTTGSTTSNPAVLRLITTPVVTSQPLDVNVRLMQQGANILLIDEVSGQVIPLNAVSFDVKVRGGAMSYQWYRNGLPISNGADLVTGRIISGATTAVLTLSNIKTTADAGSYMAVATNVFGAVTSRTALLRVTALNMIVKPMITSDLDPSPPYDDLIHPNGWPKGVAIDPYTITANTINASTNPADKPSYAATGLPRGLTVNSKTGVISGRPTKSGNYLVTLKALKKATGTASATKLFRIAP